jgi:hypothetical protein
MTCTLCYAKSQDWQKEDYICSKCNTLFIEKPIKQFCEKCRYKTLPLPLDKNRCSGCGIVYEKIEVIIEEEINSNIFWEEEL